MEKEVAPKERRQAEGIMDQYVYALGFGGGPQWVTRKALHHLRQHYFRSILAAVRAGHDWDANAPHVLDYVRAIGQLAGTYALQDGRHTIDVKDLSAAIERVESQYQIEDVEPGGDGVWCPPPK